MDVRRVVIIIILLVVVQQVFAQDTTATKQEVWPEVNLFYKLNKKFRLFGFYSATKLKNSSFTDGGYGICVDYFSLPWVRGRIDTQRGRDTTLGYYLWLRAGYLHSSTPSDDKDPIKENTLLTEANGRFYLPYNVLLTNKHRIDWRFDNGDFKPRYRFRLNFEKDMHTDYLFFTPYIYGEYFLNMYEGGSATNRFRLCAGSELRVATHVNFEMYFLYQFDNGKSLDAVTAAGFVLKFYFDHQGIKKNKKDLKTNQSK